MQGFTEIRWIGNVKQSGDQWSVFTKEVYLDKEPTFAVIRLDAYGVTGIYINGEFIEASTGRYPGRVACFECTSALHKGKNEIRIKSGSSYYDYAGGKVKDRRGSWFSAIAAELKVKCQDKEYTVTTDESWSCSSDCGSGSAKVFSDVTESYYERFWKVAALWREPKEICIPHEIIQIVGKEYGSYVKTLNPRYAYPAKRYDTNMEELSEGVLLGHSEESYASYDFGRLQVGYLELEYEAEKPGRVKFRFDYSEDQEELNRDNSITLRYPIEQGRHTLQVLHRRGGRYVKALFDRGAGHIRLLGIRFRLSMKMSEQSGWYRCSDQTLNDIWEVGKYTLQVNKHQEYESCPRNEMKFFSGDGIIASLVDYYAFGDDSLVEPSLAITEIDNNSGLQHNIYDRNTALWDYPAWYIIMAYNNYRYYANKRVIEKNYDQMVLNLQWMIQKMSREGLIYQYPVFGSPFYMSVEAVEYTCSCDRLGEKPYLNALLYHCLKCMSELADVMQDERGKTWETLAEKVRVAFNERLWNEEQGAYLDTYDTSYIPQDGNALAVLFGLADEKKAKRALETLKKNNWSPYGVALINKELNHTRGGNVVSPVVCMYEAEARLQQKQSDEALELIRRCWGMMIQKGAGTFWEYAPNNGTERWPTTAHGWSAGCTYLLSAYVLGIRPQKLGYDTLLFEPCNQKLEFSGVVPTARGLVAVSCTIENEIKKYKLCVPQGMEVQTELPEGAELEIILYEAQGK